VRATKFEFEKRFWISTAIYCVGFLLYAVDRVPFFVALPRLIAPSIAPDAPEVPLMNPWAAVRFMMAATTFERIVIAAGALLVFLAVGLRTWATAYLRTEVVHDTAQHSEALVADGPFRYTRNPLYLANVLGAAGIGFLASRSGFIFLVLAMWIYLYRLILREEESLLKTQGESYRAYCRAVPRFWPAIIPRVPSGNLQPRWGQAFAGESFVWLIGLALLLIAATLNPWIALAAFLLRLFTHFLTTKQIQKQ